MLVGPLEHNREALETLCRQCRVRKLEVYGSGLDAQAFNPAQSDLDMLVEFEFLPPGHHAECYFTLLEGLQDLFQRPIDLVMAGAVRNPWFIEGIGDRREVLYGH